MSGCKMFGLRLFCSGLLDICCPKINQSLYCELFVSRYACATAATDARANAMTRCDLMGVRKIPSKQNEIRLKAIDVNI